MITHGHGQGYYGHFAIGLWPSDPSFIVGSISLCPRNLERDEMDEYGDLAHDGLMRSNNTLFDALNSRKALDHHFLTIPCEHPHQSVDQLTSKGYHIT